MTLCVCGSGLAFDACCQRYIGGSDKAPTPEALMRSRYTAYALGGHGEYLLKTWHPATAAGVDVESLSRREVDWISLEVKSSAVDGDSGSVHFVATSRSETGFDKMEEISAFTRVAGRWLYIGGEVSQTKADIGRNDTCPCGSGKKYKKCCLNAN